MDSTRLYSIHCLSPVHVGAGEGTGMIDMPLIREKATNWPFIPGSSIKGAMREQAESRGEDDEWIQAALGAEKDQISGNAGSLNWSDGRIFAFPVASMNGTFAYVSCPSVLHRLQRDAQAAGIPLPSLPLDSILQKLRSLDDSKEMAVVPGAYKSSLVKYRKIELDEFRFHAYFSNDLLDWLKKFSPMILEEGYATDLFISRFVVLNDDAFQYFVTMCSEVIPRIRISELTKTVDDNGPWLEEYLPTETILYGVVWSDHNYVSNSNLTKSDLMQRIEGQRVMQIGGNASVGKGRAYFRVSKGVQQ